VVVEVDLVAGMADATAGMAVGVTATEAVTEVAMVAEGNFEVFIKFLRSPSVTAQWVSICFCSKRPSKLIKGNIISEGNCGVLNFPKDHRNYFEDFCPSL